MKFSDFTIRCHPYFRNGIQMRAELPNGNGISIVSGSGAYCSEHNFEIAPLFEGELMDIDAWCDQVHADVTPEEIDIIIKHMYNDTPEQYKTFLESFEFGGELQSMEDVIDSITDILHSSLNDE